MNPVINKHPVINNNNKKRKIDEVKNDEEENFLLHTSDTELIINSIYNEVLLSEYHIQNNIKTSNLSIIFLHQIYACLSNKTLVNEEVDVLRNNCKYKLLNSSHVSSLVV